jgi:putative transcriptional regulator
MINLDVKKIRKSLRMTQEEFAQRFEFPVGTLRHWEQGQREPNGPARVLLMVIATNPDVVCEAIEVARTRR